jgi:hypothetical protein
MPTDKLLAAATPALAYSISGDWNRTSMQAINQSVISLQQHEQLWKRPRSNHQQWATNQLT